MRRSLRVGRYGWTMPADLDVTCDVCGDGEPGVWEALPGLCSDCAVIEPIEDGLE